jgi:hypothetical protein
VQHEAVDHLRSAFGEIRMLQLENRPFRVLTVGAPERYDPFLSGMDESCSSCAGPFQVGIKAIDRSELFCVDGG